MAEERAGLVPAREDAAPRRAGGGESADHLGRAAKVSDVIEREARETERAGTMTRPVVDALVDSALFWILLPGDLGGGGQGVVTSSRRHVAVRASDDAREAAQAFIDKRPPRFNGK